MRYSTDDVQEFGNALQDVWQNTDIGREYLRSYHSDEDFDEHFDLIRSTAIRVAGGNPSVTEDEIARWLCLVITAGLIKPRKAAPAPLEESPADTRPRDRNGKVLSSSQLAFSEMSRWANEHSSNECRTRAKNDEQFAKFMRTRLRQEMNDVPVETAVSAGYDGKPAAASAEIQQFAEAYNAAPVSSLRAINGVVTLAGRKYLKAEFDALVAKGSQARLIF